MGVVPITNEIHAIRDQGVSGSVYYNGDDNSLSLASVSSINPKTKAFTRLGYYNALGDKDTDAAKNVEESDQTASYVFGDSTHNYPSSGTINRLSYV